MTEMTLGKTGVRVSRLGIGAMTWGDPAAIPRWNPARLAYGLTGSREDQQRALEASIAAGVTLPAQVAPRWLIERGALPIPGARNGNQAAHNAGALDFSLSAVETDALDEATRAWRR